jgi:membrane dipeptidase
MVYEAPVHERGLQDHLYSIDLRLHEMRAGKIDASIFAICLAGECMRVSPAAEALRELDGFMAEVENPENRLELVTSAQSIRAAKQNGRIAGLLSFEGAEPLEGQLSLLRMFYRLGVRVIGLTWSLRNAAADGVYERESGSGLTRFGVELVKEADRLGMLIDVAHLAPKGLAQVLSLTSRPVIDSHTASDALRQHARNRTDAQLESVAKAGGVIGVVAVPSFLSEVDTDATIETFLDHVDHIVSVAGVDHVGFGADMDGWYSHTSPPVTPWPRGFEDATKWPNLRLGLVRRGYSEAEIEKLMGENFMRVVEQTIG